MQLFDMLVVTGMINRKTNAEYMNIKIRASSIWRGPYPYPVVSQRGRFTLFFLRDDKDGIFLVVFK